MKNALEILKNFVITVYILLIIFVTICLLSFNDYKVTVLGDNTLIPIIDEDLEPNYTVGDLVIVNKGRLSAVESGDEIFFYRTVSGETTIHFATVTKAERVTDTEFTYTVEGDYMFSSSNYIGEVKDATVIPYAGKVLSVLQSKWGFLFLGVFPALVAFLYTLYNVFVEIKEVKEAEKRAKKKKKKKKAAQKAKEANSNNVVKDEVENNEETKIECANTEEVVTEEKTEDVTLENKEKEESGTVENVIEQPIVEKVEEQLPKVETTISIEREVPEEKVEDKEEKENVIPEENKEKQEEQEELTPEQKKKALIEAKMKSMTEEEKRALIEAKLKSMTPEEKRALIEAKKKKMEAEKNKKGE